MKTIFKIILLLILSQNVFGQFKTREEVYKYFDLYFAKLDSISKKPVFVRSSNDINDFIDVLTYYSKINPKYVENAYPLPYIWKIGNDDLESWRKWYKNNKSKIKPFHINRYLSLWDSINTVNIKFSSYDDIDIYYKKLYSQLDTLSIR